MAIPPNFEQTKNPANQNIMETIYDKYPPLQAYSNTSTPALRVENDADGPAVFGKSAKGDAIHGESSGTNMSGVAGIHSSGGNGVYGASSGNAGYFNGNVQVNGNVTVTGDILLPAGADCAEHFDVGNSQALQPGNVVVFGNEGKLMMSYTEYDRRAAGVVAGAGNFKPGIILDARQEEGAKHAPVSLVGKAYCCVDAKYGPVQIGDPLTTSNTPGYAMRATDPSRAFGSVIGKALAPLEEGQDLIPILVTLQ